MLTPEEENRLQELRGKYVGTIPNANDAQSTPSNLSPEEEDRLLELRSRYSNEVVPETRKYEEADLGFGLRAQHSIEPLQSNRIALLRQELGEENVKVDNQGEVFVNTDGYFKPVNVEGFSVADAADLAGSIPEVAGTAIGGLMGMGAATVPGAIAGGALGSAARQGLSATLGTPQVAQPLERAVELGISGVAGGVGSYAGKQLAKLGTKLMSKKVVDESFEKAAKKIKLKLTDSQKMGKDIADLEKAYAEIPIIGRNAKRSLNKQIDQVKKNITDEVGDFTDIHYDRLGSGNIAKQKAVQINKAIKQKAVLLYDEVSEKGSDVVVESNTLKKSLSDKLRKMGIMDDSGLARPYNVSAKTSKGQLTEDQFKKVQRVTMQIMDAIDETAKSSKGFVKGAKKGMYSGAGTVGDSSGFINATQLNSLRKSIDANIKEAGAAGLDDAALIELREAFMDVTEDMLGSKSTKLKMDFRKARQLYSKYLNDRKVIQKDFGLSGVKEIADEKVVDKIMANSDTIQKYIDLTDHGTAEQIGVGYIKNLSSKLIGSEKQKSAVGLLKKIKERREVLRLAFGDKKYKTLIDNLTVMVDLGESINPSRTALVEILTNPLKSVGTAAQYGLAKGAFGIGKNISKIPKQAVGAASYLPLKEVLSGVNNNKNNKR